MSGSKRKLHAPYKGSRVGPAKGGTRNNRKGRRVDRYYDHTVEDLIHKRNHSRRLR